MRKGFLSLQLLLLTFFFLGASHAYASDWRALKAKALELAIQGADDDAHTAYEQAISKAKDQFGESAPFIGELYFEMGEMDLAAKKFSWADDSLSQACRLMPNSPSAHLKLAELLLLQDRSAEARDQASIILQKHKDCLAARQILASSYHKQGDEAKSVKEFYNYTIGAAVGPILPPAPAAEATVTPDLTKLKNKSVGDKSDGKGLKSSQGKAQTNQSKAQIKSSPGDEKALLPPTPSTSLLKSRQAKPEDKDTENALMPQSVVSNGKALKEKIEAHKAKAKARGKAASEAQSKKAQSAKRKARSAQPEVIPLKAKPSQLKIKQKGVPRGLVPPPPPMVPSFGGFVPPPAPPVVESHAKPKEKPKETAKESTKESSKESAKETAKESPKESAKETSKPSGKEAGGKEQAHNAAPGEGSDFLLDWAGPKKKGH